MASELPTQWPFFDARHRDFAPSFRAWVSQHLAQFENDDGQTGAAARDIFRRLGHAQWLQKTAELDQTPGGPRLDLRYVCLMREILGYSSAIADVAFSEPWLAILPIVLHGNDAQLHKYVEPYCSGDLLPAFALSEPEAGSDVAAIATSAAPTAGGYTLRGRKTWTSNSGLADAYVVFARTEGDAGAHGISAFVVDSGTPGVTLEQRLRVLPPHTVGTLRFEDCRVPATALLGEAGRGFEIAMRALELFRTTVAAATVGFARRAFDEALARSTQRVAFKKPIGEHQLIQEKLADMAVKVDAAALLTYRAAWLHDSRNAPIGREASIAKLYCSEAAQEVVDQALQIWGGMGVVHGTVVERLYRHVRAFRIFDGTSEIQKLVIAKHLLKG
jgi:acyl-CoA dehydrogenase